MIASAPTPPPSGRACAGQDQQTSPLPAPPRGGRAGQLQSSGLRPGWTTGACATAAARAAFVALITGDFPDPVTVVLPQSRTPAFALTREDAGEGWARVAITKDAGDDPDITHGAIVFVTLRYGVKGSGVVFRADSGVGQVSLPGIPLAVGEPAINPMPRKMILENLSAAATDLGLGQLPDLEVWIGIEKGEELAKHTLNSRLGILGGLSVLGTTGVVVPYSCSAWIEVIRRGINVAQAAGLTHLAAATGSTSEKVAVERFHLPELALIDMGDFVGAVLKYIKTHPVPRLSLVGGIGKFAKLADGHLDLHSARSHIDFEFLARLAAGVGADELLVAQVAASSTALEAIELAAARQIDLAAAVASAAKAQAQGVLGDAKVALDVVCIDRAGSVLGVA